MDFIFSLAHFCEIHGPTSVLCTQALPKPCRTCSSVSTASSISADDDPHSLPKHSHSWHSASTRSRTMSSVANTTDSDLAPVSPADDETPPSSPGVADDFFNPYFPKTIPRAESEPAFGGGVDIDSDSCASCAFVVPESINNSQGKVTDAENFPVLRTMGSFPVPNTSPIESQDTTGQDIVNKSSWDIPQPKQSLHRQSQQGDGTGDSSTASSYSNSAFPTLEPKTHAHTLAYLTTRHPASPAAYSLLRRSCIRTLSCENLPRGSPSGPILFGDPVTGYTIAFIFRLPDPRARGRRRTYALIALGGRDCWRASAAMVEITRAFASIAAWIMGLAEQSLEAATAAAAAAARSTPASAPQPGAIAATPDTPVPAVSAPSATIAPVSSFLLAKKLDPDGHYHSTPFSSAAVTPNFAGPGAGSGNAGGAQGLAEIVGRDSIFVELHVRFVSLLMGLGRSLGV